MSEEKKIGGLKAGKDEDGRAYFEFDGKIKSTDELLTTAQDVIGAINELFQSGTGGGDDNSLIVGVYIYSDAINVVTDSGEVDENGNSVWNDHYYYFDKKNFSKEVKTTASTTGSDGTVTKTTTTKTFSKNIIQNVYNSELVLIYRCELDENGKMLAVYDGEDNEILLTEPVEVV